MPRRTLARLQSLSGKPDGGVELSYLGRALALQLILLNINIFFFFPSLELQLNVDLVLRTLTKYIYTNPAMSFDHRRMNPQAY